jgi:hypothetical protein
VIRANSLGVTRQEQRWVIGNMVGIWNKVSWLQDTPAATPNTHAYPSIIVGAEHSWNWWPDLFEPRVPLADAFFDERPPAQMRIAMEPVPNAGKPEPIALPRGGGPPALPVGTIEFGALRFRTEGVELAPRAGQRATVEVGRPAAALYFLHGMEPGDRDAMAEALKAAGAWEGIHLGSYEIEYASGQKVSVPIRYPMELQSPGWGACPLALAYRALGVHRHTLKTEGRDLYAVQWINPRREDPVARVRLTVVDAPARPILAGLAVQEPSR